MLLSLIFTMQNAYSDEYFELDSIPEEYRFPKYNNIGHSPINIEYKVILAKKIGRCRLYNITKQS